jgi:hypothetical protein
MYTPKLCDENPNTLFVFGDNLREKGLGGQANIRNMPNSIGIPTKVFPGYADEDYFSDNVEKDVWMMNLGSITSAIGRILALPVYDRLGYTAIALPKGGFGTGLAEMPTRAPKLFKKMNELLLVAFNFDNTKGELVNYNMDVYSLNLH